MSDGMSAYGTLLGIGDGGTPETFNVIAEVNSIGGPGLSMDTIDITHHESLGGWKEYIAGLLDAGEVSLDLNFIPTENTHTVNAAGSLLYAMVNRALTNFELTWPDSSSTEWTFAALVTAFEPSAPVDGKLGASVTLKVSGQPSVLV